MLGPLDPAMTRDLAAAAACSPASRWEVIIVDQHGYAVGHGIARPGRGRRQQPQPPGPGLLLRAAREEMNITVTETLLHQLAAQAAPAAVRRALPDGWHPHPRNHHR